MKKIPKIDECYKESIFKIWRRLIYGKGMKRGSEDIQLVILLIKNCVDHQNFTMFLQPPIDLREMSCD